MRAHRMRACDTARGVDFIYGDAGPHETDMDQLGGIDFTRVICRPGGRFAHEHRGRARKKKSGVRKGWRTEPGTPVNGKTPKPKNNTGIKREEKKTPQYPKPPPPHLPPSPPPPQPPPQHTHPPNNPKTPTTYHKTHHPPHTTTGRSPSARSVRQRRGAVALLRLDASRRNRGRRAATRRRGWRCRRSSHLGSLWFQGRRHGSGMTDKLSLPKAFHVLMAEARFIYVRYQKEWGSGNMPIARLSEKFVTYRLPGRPFLDHYSAQRENFRRTRSTFRGPARIDGYTPRKIRS